MERTAYPSDLSDGQWTKIETVLSKFHSKAGRPAKYPRREIWNAIFYQARTGCEWRYLPHDLPPWEDVWDHFRRWRDNGLLQRVHDALRESVRTQERREPTPSAAIIDSQTVKTAQKGGPTAMMQARRSKAANVTLPWTPPAFSWLWSSIVRLSKIGMEPNSSL